MRKSTRIHLRLSFVFLMCLALAISAVQVKAASEPSSRPVGDEQEDFNCVPDGSIDDTLGRTDCCSGSAVPGSTYCTNPDDYGTTWESCSQICGAT